MQGSSNNKLICQYTEKEVERHLNERIQSIEDGKAVLISNNEVKAHIKAMFL